MANIKWTGIEQKKYGLTARWYVSAYYGNDVDVDAVGLYNPSTNPTGHGGKERPFATEEKVAQVKTTSDCVVYDGGVYDGGAYTSGVNMTGVKVGDGVVIFSDSIHGTGSFNNIIGINLEIAGSNQIIRYNDCFIIYSNITHRSTLDWRNNILIECTLTTTTSSIHTIFNTVFIRCTGGGASFTPDVLNCIFINNTLGFSVISPRPIGRISDYCIIIGLLGGKTREQWANEGNYFLKSYSEVDLFGNASGSGATVAQINEIFNNYYSPIYIDDWQNADFTLRPDTDDRVKFGGLNGTYIGAKPVGHRYSAFDLWNTHVDAVNTAGLQYDMVNNAIVLDDLEDVGVYRSVRISMSKPIPVDLVAFFANFVYNIEGTAKQGVANQRIDTTPDLEPDNTKNQRVVYDYRLQVAPDTVTALSAFKNYELNREPTVDGTGKSQLDTDFNSLTEQKQTVQDFIVEFTLRRVIID